MLGWHLAKNLGLAAALYEQAGANEQVDKMMQNARAAVFELRKAVDQDVAGQ
jgi:hypothetical protein